MIRHLFDKTLHVSQLPRVAMRVDRTNGKTYVTGDLLDAPVEVMEGDRVITGLIPQSPSTFRCLATLHNDSPADRALKEAVARGLARGDGPIVEQPTPALVRERALKAGIDASRAVAEEAARGVVLIRRGRGRPPLSEEERERRRLKREAARYDESKPVTDWMK